MSVVTNFMSQVEFFSRYNSNGIYGLSGTLGIECTATTRLLREMFEVKVCCIPPHKRRKLFENNAIIVNGSQEQWFGEIMKAVDRAVEKKSWKGKGRAVLILCEDIRTAEQLKQCVLQRGLKQYTEETVKLYAHSNSDEMKCTDHTFKSGEVVIATNLAGRGTDIKVTKEVNESGGLFCIVTFLARNRRVEQQAFGRTAQKGEPGSAQCIIHASSLPQHFQGQDLDSMRELRERDENARLDRLMRYDITQVRRKESLFKKHCAVLAKIDGILGPREDKQIMIDCLNENWGQWLQIKNKEISSEECNEEFIFQEIDGIHSKLMSLISTNFDVLSFPMINVYHLIKFANNLLITPTNENLERAHLYYTRSIELEPRYALASYYNRAYCIIICRKRKHRKEEALKDLNNALRSLASYRNDLTYVSQSVNLVRNINPPNNTKAEVLSHDPENDSDDCFTKQIKVRMQMLDFIAKNLEESIKKLNDMKESDNIEASPLAIFSLMPAADKITHGELYALWNRGLEITFSLKIKPAFCWSALVVFVLGAVEIAAGVALATLSVGFLASFGMGLITEGISDCIDGIIGMVTGEFSWLEWGASKAIGLAVSLISGGVARVATKGVKVIQIGKAVRKLGTELKAASKITRKGFTECLKTNSKNVGKYVGKELVMEGVGRALDWGENKIFEIIVADFGKRCKKIARNSLTKSFIRGSLGVSTNIFIATKVEHDVSIILDDEELPPMLEREACSFFTSVGHEAMKMLLCYSKVEEKLKSASLSLFHQLSEKHKGGKALYKAIEGGLMAGIIADAVTKVSFMIAMFIPETERICREYQSEVKGDISPSSQPEISQFHSVKSLKLKLVEVVGDVFATSVATILQQNLGSVVNHGLNRTINHVGREFVSDRIRRQETFEAVKAGQGANYIRHMDLFPSDSPDAHMIMSYAKQMEESHTPGSILELKAAVLMGEYGRGVTIYEMKKGKRVLSCSIDPQSSSKHATSSNIELIYTPPHDNHSPGHYDVVVDGKKRRVDPDASNCLFHAYTLGLNPELSHTEQKKHASIMRQKVVESFKTQPELWHDHILQRVEMERAKRGNHFAMLGAGVPKNEKTKVHPELYYESIDGNKLHTFYVQDNEVAAHVVRVYTTTLFHENGYLVDGNGSSDLKLKEMHVTYGGLNFSENEGRCFHTQYLSGMILHHGGLATDTEVAYHPAPSEAGANVGDRYGGLSTSPYYNILERDIWRKEVTVGNQTKTMREWIGEKDFNMTVKATISPLVPNNFETFFQNLNAHRRKTGRPEVHPTNKSTLRRRLNLVQSMDPRAYRVTKLDNQVTVNGHTETVRMPIDYDIHIPDSYTLPNQRLKEQEIRKGRKKVPRQTFNVAPTYRKPPLKPNSRKVRKFEQLKKK